MQHPEEGTIHAWIDGALDPVTAREVDTHLASCEACARLAAEARGLVAASSRILTALDDVPAKVIPGSGAAAKPAERAVARRWPMPFWMRTAAAVVIVAGASALVMTGKLNSPERKRADSAVPEEVAMQATVIAEAAPAELPAPERDLAANVPSAASSQAAETSRPFSARAPSVGDPKPGRPGSRTETDRRAVATRGVTRSADELQQKARADHALDRVADASQRVREEASVVAGVVAGAAAPARDSRATGTDVAAMTPATAPKAPDSGPPAAAAKRSESLAQSAVRTPIQTGIAGTLSRRSASAPSPMASDARITGTHPSVGCYALSLSPWSGGTIPFGSPPPRIELDSLTSIQESIRGLNLVHPAPGAASNGAPLAYWRALGDSVYVTWRDDQRGVVVKLPIGGEVMAGSARTLAVSTGNVPAQSSTVEARRISCRD